MAATKSGAKARLNSCAGICSGRDRKATVQRGGDRADMGGSSLPEARAKHLPDREHSSGTLIMVALSARREIPSHRAGRSGARFVDGFATGAGTRGGVSHNDTTW